MNKLEFNIFDGISIVPYAESNPAHTHQWITTGTEEHLDRQTRDVKAEYAQNGKSDRYTALKKNLPAASYGGIFTNRTDAALTEFSGLYCCDIDGITQEKIAKIKTDMSNHENCIMYYISPSGNGIKVIFRVNEIISASNTFKFATAYFEDYFVKKYQLDQSQNPKQFDTNCSNISRIHFLAHDPDAYLNLGANSITFNVDNSVKENEINVEYYGGISQQYSKQDIRSTLESIKDYLTNQSVSITSTYDQWIRLAFFLKDNFNQVEAFDIFDDFSKCDSNYDSVKVQTKFNQCLGSNYKGDPISLGTVMYYARAVGYTPNLSGRGSHIKRLRRDMFKLKLVSLQIKLRINRMNLRLQRYHWKKKRWEYSTDTDIIKMFINDLEELVSKEIGYDYLAAFAPIYRPDFHFIKDCKTQLGLETIDYIKVLCETLHTDNDEMTYQMIRKWFIGAVACIRDDYKVNENTLVLVGGQGIGKTRWAAKLLPKQWDEYFIIKNLDPKDKDDRRLLSNRWVILNDEFSNITSRKDNIEKYKYMSSLPKVTDRNPFGKQHEDMYRKASLVATINHEDYLRDLSGNRRFWNIMCKTMDHNHNVDMMKVWGYANKLYEAKENFWMSDEQFEALETHNQQFEVEISDREYIETHFDIPTRSDVQAGQIQHLSSTKLIRQINHIEGEKVMTWGASAIGRLMKKIGFKKDPTRGWIVKYKHSQTIYDPVNQISIFNNITDEN